MDVFTPEKRSAVMARIRGRDTKMEVRVRSWLFREGFRFRKNDKRLPGKPDIVLPRYKSVILIHGCFWHGHTGCPLFVIPKTRSEFWLDKIRSTKGRDERNIADLTLLDWRVVVLWECELERDFDGMMMMLKSRLKADV